MLSLLFSFLHHEFPNSLHLGIAITHQIITKISWRLIFLISICTSGSNESVSESWTMPAGAVGEAPSAWPGWQRAPRLTLSPCCGCPWCTFCNTGPQLSSPWWSHPSFSCCPHAMGCSGACWGGWPGDVHDPGCGCAAVLALPAVIQLQFSRHGALLPFAAASQHGAGPQWGSVLVSVKVLLSWMETKYFFLDKIPGVPWSVSFWTKKKDKGVTFLPPKRIAFTVSLIPNCAAISQGVLTSFPIF